MKMMLLKVTDTIKRLKASKNNFGPRKSHCVCFHSFYWCRWQIHI